MLFETKIMTLFLQKVNKFAPNAFEKKQKKTKNIEVIPWE